MECLCRVKKHKFHMMQFEECWHSFWSYTALLTEQVCQNCFSFSCFLNARAHGNANQDGPQYLWFRALGPSLEGDTQYPMPILTFATRIRWTGSESSNTTKPKLGSFPPTPLVLMRSSTTFPKPGETKGKRHSVETCSASSTLCSFQTPVVWHCVKAYPCSPNQCCVTF